MKKTFYNHLVHMDDVHMHLDMLEVSDKEKEHLITLIHANIHTTVLHRVLDELSEEERKIVLMHLQHEDHEHVWTLITTKITDAEEKIRETINGLLKEFQEDIKEAKNKL